mgnify:CR=1 FL=1|tara:strand:+ start:96252 stop:98171 length:1920 start_codon:yes stop_codon:yes gene_type:complete
MSWDCPPHIQTNFKSGNEELALLSGHLDDTEAKIALVKYLRANIGLASELIIGIKLELFQEIVIRNMFNANYSMLVFGRGLGKSFLASIFCILYCIFNANTKIILAGPTFRTSRNMFDEMERFIESRSAMLAASCFIKDNKRRATDICTWKINGGSIKAIPLAGENIRGFRANCLIVDEYLQVPEDIIDRILMPFLVAPNDIGDRQKIIEQETKQIKSGNLKEEDRTNFDSESKMIALSSASYTFENLYKTFCEWKENAIDPAKYSKLDANYFVAQIGFEGVPQHMVNKTVIEEAENGGIANDAFLREYCAQFVDGSDSFFSPKRMKDLTLVGGEKPVVTIAGEEGKKYVMGIDPSLSQSAASDHFAMSILEISEDEEQLILVHSYAVAGGDLNDHIKYLYYILTNFNIVMMVVDHADFGFIQGCNTSELFKSQNLKVDYIDVDPSKQGVDYNVQIARFRKEYNPKSLKMCIKQYFHTDAIRAMNEELQTAIDRKKIYFASGLKNVGNEIEFENARYILNKMDPDFLPKEYRPENKGDKNYISDFIDFQDTWITTTKKECALVEVKTTARGVQSFDLPQHLRRSTSATRARKDNYTSLMLANWGFKFYKNSKNVAEFKPTNTFRPVRLGSGSRNSIKSW